MVDDSGIHQILWVAHADGIAESLLHASMCVQAAARATSMEKCALAGRRMRVESNSGNRQKARRI